MAEAAARLRPAGGGRDAAPADPFSDLPGFSGRPESSSSRPPPPAKVVDQLLSSEGPLDADEQARVIGEFERWQLDNSRTWRVRGGVREGG